MRSSKLTNLSSVSLLNVSREYLDADAVNVGSCFAEGIIRNVLKTQFISYS